jgi:hypothetical protein
MHAPSECRFNHLRHYIKMAVSERRVNSIIPCLCPQLKLLAQRFRIIRIQEEYKTNSIITTIRLRRRIHQSSACLRPSTRPQPHIGLLRVLSSFHQDLIAWLVLMLPTHLVPRMEVKCTPMTKRHTDLVSHACWRYRFAHAVLFLMLAQIPFFCR